MGIDPLPGGLCLYEGKGGGPAYHKLPMGQFVDQAIAYLNKYYKN